MFVIWYKGTHQNNTCPSGLKTGTGRTRLKRGRPKPPALKFAVTMLFDILIKEEGGLSPPLFSLQILCCCYYCSLEEVFRASSFGVGLEATPAFITKL